MKNKRLLSIFTAMLFLLAAYAPADAHIFYEVKTNKATVWLLGSIHMADSTFYPPAAVVSAAFDSSDYLVTEVLMDDLMSSGLDMLDSLYYPKGDSLPKHIADTTWQHVLKYFKGYGMGRPMLKKLKPSFIVMTLSQLEYVKHGYSPNWGMDMYFTRNAGKKSLLQLETAESQVQLISHMDDGEDADKMINDAFKDLSHSVALIDSIGVVWKSGDDKELYRLVSEEMEEDSQNEKDFDKKILDDRNAGMFDKIKEYFDTEKKYFVIVGAAHLLGPEGIVEKLRKAGFKVVKK